MFSFRIVCVSVGIAVCGGTGMWKLQYSNVCSQGMNAMEFGEIPYLRSLCNLGSASLSHDSEVTSQCPHNFPKGVEILQVKHSQSPPKIDVHILHWNYGGWCSHDCTFWKLLHTRYISHIFVPMMTCIYIYTQNIYIYIIYIYILSYIHGFVSWSQWKRGYKIHQNTICVRRRTMQAVLPEHRGDWNNLYQVRENICQQNKNMHDTCIYIYTYHTVYIVLYIILIIRG